MVVKPGPWVAVAVVVAVAASLVGCASQEPSEETLARPGAETEAKPVEAATAPSDRVRLASRSGLLACAWSGGDELVEDGLESVQAQLERCAAADASAAKWRVVITVGTNGGVERASPTDLENPTPAEQCATRAMLEAKFESGPPACGAVQQLEFEVAARE